jgi:hypothetical protein
MNRINVDVQGFDQLTGNIKKLSSDQKKKPEILKILRRVAKPTVTAVKGHVPVQKSRSNIRSRRTVMGGSLRQSIGLITGRKGQSRENPTIYVGPRVFKGRKFKRQGRNIFGDGWYGHMVDQGHDIYYNPSSKGQSKRNVLKRNRVKSLGEGVQGRVPGKFFMNKGFVQTKNSAKATLESAVSKYFQNKIDKMSVK